MAIIQSSFKSFPVFNTVTASSVGAAGAVTFARPPTTNIVQSFTPADSPSEIMGDVQWLVQVDWK